MLVDLKGMILLINYHAYVFNVGLKRCSIFIPQVDMHKKNGLTVYSRTESYITETHHAGTIYMQLSEKCLSL